MPATQSTPHLTLHRNGLANLNGQASVALLGHKAALLYAPTAIGGRWLLMPLPTLTEGAATLYDDRGHTRFRAQPLATAMFAAAPAGQKHVRLQLLPAPGGFWLEPANSAAVQQNF